MSNGVHARPTVPGGWAFRVTSLAGVASLGTTGSTLAPIAALATLGLLVPPPPLGTARWPWVHAAVLTGCVVLVPAIGAVEAIAALAAWLLVHQAWLRTADAARTALLLATLLLLAASIRTDSPLLAPLYIAWAAALPVTLLRLTTLGDAGPGMESRGPGRALEAGVAVLSVLVAGALFLVMPRLQGGLFAPGEAPPGRFPEDVTLGGERLRNDDLAVVMRVRVTDEDGGEVPPPWYVRARALPNFDGTRWSVEPKRRARRFTGPPNRITGVELHPEPGTQLYAVGEPDHVEGAPGVHAVADGVLHHRAPGQPLRYTAHAREASLDDAREEPEPTGQPDPALVALPPTLDPRVAAEAWKASAGATDVPSTVRALIESLATIPYEPDPPPAQGDPLAWFLFSHRAGHCEYFAGALTAMLRARGVSARVATGFYVEDVDPDGWATVRRGHAHAWTEVWTPRGWATVDATPTSGLPDPETGGIRARMETLASAWYRSVVDFDMHAQFAAWGALGRPLVAAGGGNGAPGFVSGIVGMGATVVGLTLTLAGVRLALLLATARRTRRDAVVVLVARARADVRAAGLAWPAAEPPASAAERLADVAPGVADALARVAAHAYAARYGDGRADPARAAAHLAEARRAAADVRVAARAHARR